MRALRVVHRWLGLLLALPLILMGLTGAVLTLEPAWPELGPAPAANAAALPANTLLAVGAAAVPPGMRLGRFAPAGPGEAAQATFVPEGNPRGPGLVLRLDPGTGRALGPAEPVSAVLGFIRRFHQNLLLPQYGGRQVAGWIGVGLLLLTLIGVPLWWPAPGARAAAFTVPRKARGVRLHRALHGAAGAWLLPMLLLMSVTGIAQGFPQTLRGMLNLPAGGPPRSGGGAPEAPGPLPDLEAAIRLAQGAVPGTEPRVVVLPQGREPLRLFMAPPGETGAVATRVITTDPAGTRLVGNVAPPGPADLTLRWIHDLHEAAGLGPVYRALSVLTGLSLPLFGVTGVAMWLLRRRNRRRMAGVRAAALDAARPTRHDGVAT